MLGDATERSSVLKYNHLSNGFHLTAAEMAAADRGRLLQSQDVWEAFAGILLSCQVGDFSQLPRIPDLMRRYRDWLFWKAAAELVGFAGSWGFIRQFFETFRPQVHENGVQYFLSIALANCCGLWAVEPLLVLHAAAAEEDPRYQIEGELSNLLEEEDGSIWAGAEEKTIFPDPESLESQTVVDYDAFAAEVRTVRDRIGEQAGSMDRPVNEGRVLDVKDTAERLHARLTSQSGSKGRIQRERWVFEASTGIDCRVFFDDEGAVRYLQAAAILETFLESDAAGRYASGRRFFFGHPIAD